MLSIMSYWIFFGVRTSRAPCPAPLVLSFKLVEHRGEDWHELTYQIKPAVNSKGNATTAGI